MKQVEGIYLLSPQQKGILFESLASPESGLHIAQRIFRFQEDLRLDAFERALNSVIGHHSGLRTCFVWNDHDTPLQVVGRDAFVTIYTHDWRHLSSSEQ